MKLFSKKQYEIRVAREHLFDVDQILYNHNMWRFVDKDKTVVGLRRDWSYIRLTASPIRVALIANKLKGVSSVSLVG